MALKNDAKFEEKLSCGLKNDMRNLAKLKIGTLTESFYPK